MLWRGLRDRRYFHRLLERFGRLPPSYRQTTPGAVWLHAVSVGEVISSIHLIEQLRGEFPRVFVSTTTLAGRAIAEEKLGAIVDGIFYVPLDYCFAVRAVLRALRPAVVVVMETEIWPNLWREAKRSGAGLVIVNARISDRAIPRYRRLAWFFRPALGLPDAILAQSEIARQRYLELGAPAARVSLAGNLKYDFDPSRVAPPEAVRSFLETLASPRIWIAASTMPPAEAGDVDEDDVVLDAFQVLAPSHPSMLLLLVPRRPERFEEAAAKLGRRGIPYARRSRLPGTSIPLPGVLLVDSVGELAGLFACAEVVFMGGTLARRGGHNIIEPAFFGRPVIVGPHMENFPEIAAKFREQRAVECIQNSGELAGVVARLLADPTHSAAIGRRAREVAEARGGATAMAIEHIRRRHAEALPVWRPVVPLHIVLWLASFLWRAGGALQQRLDQARRRRLETPVISIGGISMGGSGKTPFTVWLADQFHHAGLAPAILIRGYQRQESERATIVAPGESVPVSLTGDEAQILVRRGVAPVGIGADRYAAGRLLEERFRPGLILLDDGFQHRRLERRIDIVLVDALDPFAGGVFPLGRLREPPAALGRADAMIVTRAGPPNSHTGLERRLREITPAPVFFSHVIPRHWVDAVSGRRLAPPDLPFSRVAAFCGLGNPEAFWRTLEQLALRPILRETFPDHHRYSIADLKRLAAEAAAAGAEALLTTEKDLFNLPPDALAATQPLPVYWLEIGIEVEGAAELLQLIARKLREPASGAPA